MTFHFSLHSQKNRLVLLVVLGLLCAACGAPARVPMKVAVNLSADLNNDRPLPVDIVVVWEAKRKDSLTRMSPETWFSKGRSAYQGLAKTDKDIQLYTWEWVPGQEIPEGISLKSHKRCTIFIFARYFDRGGKKEIVKGYPPFLLELNKDDFRATPFKKSKAKKTKVTEDPQN